MRTIKKGREPKLLETYRQTQDATFENLPGDVKEKIQEQLVQEQRGLCCYCQSRISTDWDKMKIEHWQSQKYYPERQLDYSNMLGACSGGQKHGQKIPREQLHCDSVKDDFDLCFSVCDATHPIERKIKFSSLGRISSGDPDIDYAINKILNLNLDRLVKNRKQALTGFLEGLGRRKVDYTKELSRWDGSDGEQLSPFSQIVAHYLLRKINKGTTV